MINYNNRIFVAAANNVKDKLHPKLYFTLEKSFDSTLDFFHTRLEGLFVSERLKTALKESGAAGMVFRKEIDMVI